MSCASMFRALTWLSVATVLWSTPASAVLFGSKASVGDLANAITELDVERAAELVQQIDGSSPNLAFQRARLAIYTGDCDTAEAILQTVPERPDAQRLAELARTCARATAGSMIVEDEQRGVWVRLQDAEDRVLVPYIADVAHLSREALAKDLGVRLPDPIRIDLVRDLFSLSAVSGLPLEAAETTGTVGVARWGRITMITPRAVSNGYPWQDTLAHELTHLALTRGSRDFAPLWLQEGIAKREEDRWREKRPFDGVPDPHEVSRRALLEGNSVGVDRIGPSIAMLPSPRAASISYAEVESFMDYWVRQNGKAAFSLLLIDMKGLATRDHDQAMTSVSGYPLRYWIARWQQHLRSLPEPPEPEKKPGAGRSETVQNTRLGDLLTWRGSLGHAGGYFDQALAGAPDKPAVRFRAAANRIARDQPDEAIEAIGSLEEVHSLHGGWLGLKGRLLQRAPGAPDPSRAHHLMELAVAIDPLGVEAACEGEGGRTTPPDQTVLEPADKKRRRLCAAARDIVRH